MVEPSSERLAYRIKEVAELTGLSRSTIFRYLQSGQLKSIKIGAVTLVRRLDLVAFIDGIEPGSEPPP